MMAAAWSAPTGPIAFDAARVRGAVPAPMRDAARWLVWKAIPQAGKKDRKVPYYADGSPRRGALDTPEDRARLVSLEVALAAVGRGGFSGVGFALGPDDTGLCWQGVDFDGVTERPELAALVPHLGGWLEHSPSGRGLHAYGYGEPFEALGSNASGIEAYCAGRYFTVTGAALGGELACLRACVEARLRAAHTGARPSASGAPGPAPLAGGSFFAKVNAKALASLAAWVPALFPRAVVWRDGYRVTSKALGRDLEEDLQILPAGIMDFGEERGLSPIDLVLAWGAPVDARASAQWLCTQMGIDPATLGWRGQAERPVAVVPPAPSTRPLRVVAGTDHDPRPVIEIEDGRLPENTDDAIRYLIEARVDIYQHGNRLVRVGRWQKPVDAQGRPVAAGVLLDINPKWLVDAMTRFILFRRYDKRQDKWRKTDASTKVAETLLARQGEWPFHHLVGFVDAPTMARDGRIIDQPGFDEASGLFLSNPPPIQPIGRVSVEERDQASKRLYALFDTFPFASDADAAAALAMVMTGLLRRVLPAAPIACISASTPASGKSLLADCIAVVMTGSTAPVAAIGKDSEELEKRLDAILLQGEAICVFDNVMRAVSSDVLCQVATQSHKKIRVLAKSLIVEAPTNVMWVMTGNNLTLLNDLTRRVLVCRLDAGCERPELRSFDRDAIEHVMTHRSSAIRWALMLSKAYLDAGCPDVGAHPVGSFEVWDRLIRRALIWAGWPDPLEPAQGMREQDQEFDAMADLMLCWHDVAKGPVTAAELYALMIEQVPKFSGGHVLAHPALHEAATSAFGDLGRLSPKDLGYRLRQWSGRILQGRRIVASEKRASGGVKRWSVEMVMPTPPTS